MLDNDDSTTHKQRFPRLARKAINLVLGTKTCFDVDVVTEKVTDETKLAEKSVKMCSTAGSTITIRTPFVFVHEKLLADLGADGDELTEQQALASEIVCETDLGSSCKDNVVASLASILLTPAQREGKTVVVEPLPFNGRLILGHHGNGGTTSGTLAGPITAAAYATAMSKLPAAIREKTTHIFLYICWSGLGQGKDPLAVSLGEALKPHFAAVKDVIAPQYRMSVTASMMGAELLLILVGSPQNTEKPVFELTTSKWFRFPRWSAAIVSGMSDTNKDTCKNRGVPFVLKTAAKSQSIVCRLRKFKFEDDTLTSLPRTWK